MSDRRREEESEYSIMIGFKTDCPISQDIIIDEMRQLVFHMVTKSASSTAAENAFRSLTIDDAATTNAKENSESTTATTSGTITISISSDLAGVLLLISTIENVQEIRHCKSRFYLINIRSNRAQELGFTVPPLPPLPLPTSALPPKNNNNSNYLKGKVPTRFSDSINNKIHLLKEQFKQKGYTDNNNTKRKEITKTETIQFSDYPIVIAIVSLFASSLTLMQGDSTYANNIAIFAFAFFVIGVAWKTADFSRKKVPFRIFRHHH